VSTALQITPREDMTITGPQPYFGPLDFTSLERWAERISKSGLVPKQYIGKPDDIMVAVMYGAELGLPAMQSLNSICVINGRPGLFGDGFLAVIMSHPAFESIQEDDLVDIEKAKQATCRMKRRGMAERKVTFTMEMAKTAGLTVKDGPWKTYAARQMQMRARGFCGRDLFADVLRGVKIAEELDDYRTIEGVVTPTDSTSSPHNQSAAGRDSLPGDQARDFSKSSVITQDQARDFGKAWKASGYSMEAAKAWLKSTLDLDSSLKIPASRYAEAMTWANTAKNAAAAATTTGDAAVSPAHTTQTAQEESPEEKSCREAFGILDWNLTEQARAIEDHKGDWTKLLSHLSAELNRRDAEQ
jgi:hypothetical protein